MTSISEQVHNFKVSFNTYITAQWGRLTPTEKLISKLALGIFSLMLFITCGMKIYSFYQLKKTKILELKNQNPIPKMDINPLTSTGTITHPDGTVYEGTFDKDFRLIGQGKAVINGILYEGEFKKGYLEGIGKKTLVNHDIFEGFFIKNVLCGNGQFLSHNGSLSYEGTFIDDEFHGQGTCLRFTENIKLKGEFYNGRFVFGKKTFLDPERSLEYYEGTFDEHCQLVGPKGRALVNHINYEGEFKGGCFVKGIKRSSEEGLEGTFDNGQLQGKGKRIKGLSIFEGEFVNGKLTKGKEYSSIPNDKRFNEGTFDENYLLTGPGKGFRDGASFEGIFKNGLLEGKGTILFEDRTRFEGIFKKGLLEGEGKKIFPDGAMEEGLFVEDRLHGQGKRINAINIFEGKFENGAFISGKKTFRESKDYYEGTFNADNKLFGEGKAFVKGILYEGIFQRSLLYGTGRKTLENQNIYQGNFVKDSLEGEGEIIFPNATIYRGCFVKDELTGEGTVTINNKTERVVFKNNEVETWLDR